MGGVAKISPQHRTLGAPEELRELQAWLCWRYEQLDGEPKPRKVPIYTDGGRRHGQQGSPQDRAKLTTFAAARDAAARRGLDGVGIAMLPEWGISGLDFDKCVAADGSLPPEIMEIVGGTYAEYSPSGKGIRAFVKGDLGDHKSLNDENYVWNLEVFTGKGFLTLTGNVLPFTEVLGLENTIAPADERVHALCQKRFGSDRMRAADPDGQLDPYRPPHGLSDEDIAAYLSDLDPSMGRDEWIRVGMSIAHETDGAGFSLWDDWSANGVQYPGSEALQTQWSSLLRRDTRKEPVTFATVKAMSAKARAERGEPPRGLAQLAELADVPQMLGDPVYATPPDWQGKYVIHSEASYSKRPSPPWIIKGLLPKADLGVIFGASGSGKSFLALELALAIARGVWWRGNRTRQGRVLLIAAEGSGGVAQRLRGYRMHHNIPEDETLPLGVIAGAPNLLVEDDITELVKAIVAAGGGELIIIDTFAQVTPGSNENSGEDMGKALRHARAITDATHSMVLLIHHSGKDQSKGARGWSGIRAAADVELEVIRPEEGDVRILRVSKQKDGRDDMSWGFRLEDVSLGNDEDGDEIFTKVVVEADVSLPSDAEPEGTAPRKRRLGPLETVLVDSIEQLPSDVESMSIAAFVEHALMRMPRWTGPGRDHRSNNMARAVHTVAKAEDAPFVLADGLVHFGKLAVDDAPEVVLT